jgi:signal peptide peptidase SppA
MNRANPQSQFTLSMPDLVWLGNLQSMAEIRNRLLLLQQGVLPASLMPMMPMEPEDDEEEDDPDEPPTRYVDLKGPLAVITTQGALTNQNSFMNWLMGGTTYNQVRESFLEAATLVRAGHAKEILHIVKSPGGSAQGVEDTGALIRQIAQDICPVSTYAQEACSAAYWIAAAGSKIYASASSNLGSIGTRMSIPNFFKAMEEEGIAVHNIVAGKYKAMGDPTQPWTKEAEEYLQARVEAINGVFTRTVSEYRAQPLAYVEEKMAQGREFTGEQAYDVHLIDRVVTLDRLVQQMQSALSQKRTPSI